MAAGMAMPRNLKRPWQHSQQGWGRLTLWANSHGQGQPTLPYAPDALGAPSLPRSPSTHLPDCAWQWPRRSVAWHRRPWLSPAASAPCSCTWPNGRNEREARRQVRSRGQTGRQDDTLTAGVPLPQGSNSTTVTEPGLPTHCREQQK